MYEELVRTLSSCPDAEYGCSNCKYKYSLGCREKLMSDASNAIEKLQEDSMPINDMEIILSEVAKPLWIPVTERLPELNTLCLLYNKYYGPMVGARIDDMRFRIFGSRFPDTPTHWMPLPSTEGLNET
jgi:hypothetical protein